MGHEFTGLIDEVGANVTGFALGERVVMATSIACGECHYCHKGWPNLCLRLAPMGFSFPGGMAEYVTIPALALRGGHVIKVPPGVKATHAALAEPLSCTVNAAENCQIQAGDTVVVVGAGPMGILNACTAREFGAKIVILAEVNENRLKQAAAFGIDVLVNPGSENLAEIVLKQTDGIGADVVIVAAPAARPQEEALTYVRKRGTLCLFASLPVGKNLLSIDSRAVHYGEVRIVGSSDSAPLHVEKAVSLLASGQIPAEKIVTHRMPLAGIHTAFELMQSGEALRVVLEP
jgi:L-iditol 2-dehydrogenase